MPLRYACLALGLLMLGSHALAESGAPPTGTEAPPKQAALPERAPLAERSQVDARALERQLAQQEQQQLNAGEETFLALWLPANVAEANGAVILLPGDAESVDWPLSVGPLRRKLPDAGWHSLSLSLPDPQGDVPPVRQVASANQAPQPDAAPVGPTSGSKDAADTATPAATQEPLAVDAPEARRTHHAERVLARIAAGIAFARQHQARTIVLLGHGSGAYWAARYLAEQEPDDVHNLLLVAAARPAGFSPPLEELIPSLKLATGDFYYQDRPDERSAALKRMQAGKRQKHPAYLQIAMQALPGNPTIAQEQLFRRIRGWLELHLRAAVATPGS